MPKENPSSEIAPYPPTHEIAGGILFKPFDGLEDFFDPAFHGRFPIPEEYDYFLILRRDINYHGLEGFIDVISDNPESWIESLVGRYPLEKPLGEAAFAWKISNAEDVNMPTDSIAEAPFILRFSFILKSPKDYIKLLNSYVDVNCGDEEFQVFFNYHADYVKRNLKRLEVGKPLVVTEINMFNKNILVEELGNDGNEEIPDCVGRITVVWLPGDLDKLKTIKMTFNFFDDYDKYEETPPPVRPLTLARL